MLVAVLFWLLAISACAVALAWGGRDGRWGAAMVISASALTMVLSDANSWLNTNMAVMMVDAAMLMGMVALAMVSRSYWPMWFAAFQLIGTATHLATIMVPTIVPMLYQMMSGLWAIPTLLAMVLGIVADHNARTIGRPETI